MLFAEGKESTEITVSESTDSSSDSTITRTYSETNPFYSEDISHLLTYHMSFDIRDSIIISYHIERIAIDNVF